MKTQTYDVVFNDSFSSDNKGFEESYEYCKDYIETWNGSDYSYFEDYKKGTVSIVCNETDENVFATKIK